MDIIEQHRKTARKLSKKNGTSHQAELNAIAKAHGHAAWGPYLATIKESQTSADLSELTAIPEGRKSIEIYALTIARKIMAMNERFGPSQNPYTEDLVLRALLVVEIIRAQNEGRPASIFMLRDWLTSDLEQMNDAERRGREEASAAGSFYNKDPQQAYFQSLAKKAAESHPYGRAYAEMTRVASMAPSERFQILMEIIPALSDFSDDRVTVDELLSKNKMHEAA